MAYDQAAAINARTAAPPALDPPRRILRSWRRRGDNRGGRVAIDLVEAAGGTDRTVVADQLDARTAGISRPGRASGLDRRPAYV